MIKQYPYVLEVFTSGESTYNEQTGEWIIEEGEWVEHSKCRDEVSSSGGQVVTTDGEVYSYTWIVLMPKGVAEIKPGTKVRVMDGDDMRLEANAIRFSSDQLHCRLWL